MKESGRPKKSKEPTLALSVLNRITSILFPVARWAQQLDVFDVAGSATRHWLNMVGMVFAQLASAIGAAASLQFEQALKIIRRVAPTRLCKSGPTARHDGASDMGLSFRVGQPPQLLVNQALNAALFPSLRIACKVLIVMIFTALSIGGIKAIAVIVNAFVGAGNVHLLIALIVTLAVAFCTLHTARAGHDTKRYMTMRAWFACVVRGAPFGKRLTPRNQLHGHIVP